MNRSCAKKLKNRTSRYFLYTTSRFTLEGGLAWCCHRRIDPHSLHFLHFLFSSFFSFFQRQYSSLNTTFHSCKSGSANVCKTWIFGSLIHSMLCALSVTAMIFFLFLPQVKSTGQQLLDIVCDDLNLLERDFFGLRYQDKQDQLVSVWLIKIVLLTKLTKGWKSIWSDWTWLEVNPKQSKNAWRNYYDEIVMNYVKGNTTVNGKKELVQCEISALRG